MQQEQFIIDYLKPEESKQIAEFQYTMALETEKRLLDTPLVDNAIQFFFKNQDLGFYVIGHINSQPVSSLMITYSHDIFRNSNVWWIQSVFVMEQHRKKKFFTRMFQFIENQAKIHKYIIKLHVESHNYRAQAVYKSLGMYDNGCTFIEDDFHFKKDKLKYKFIQGLVMEQLKDLKEFEGLYSKTKSLLDNTQENVENIKKGVQYILNNQGYGKGFIMKLNEEFMGMFYIFFEFSDWRYGLVVYINEIAFSLSVKEELYQDLVESILNFIIQKMQSTLPVTCLRIVLKDNSPFAKITQKIGLETSVYRIYQKLF